MNTTIKFPASHAQASSPAEKDAPTSPGIILRRRWARRRCIGADTGDQRSRRDAVPDLYSFGALVRCLRLSREKTGFDLIIRSRLGAFVIPAVATVKSKSLRIKAHEKADRNAEMRRSRRVLRHTAERTEQRANTKSNFTNWRSAIPGKTPRNS